MNITTQNDIRKHTFSIPALMADAIRPVFRTCFQALKDHDISKLERIIITGCGYSYAAALAARDQITESVKLPVTVSPAIEVSRFSHPDAVGCANTLLIAISSSGSVSRINEALALYRRHGALVMGLTANLSGEIGRYADLLLSTAAPGIGRPLPLRGYAMTFLTLIALGHALQLRRLGLPYRTLEPAMDALFHTMRQLEQQLPQIDEAVLQYVSAHQDIRSFEFVGSGFERAAAFLGKIELMGQAGLLASDEDSEQWCHCNFFISAPEKTGTVLFLASRSPAASRAREALSYMCHLKRPVCVVTDDPGLTSDEGMQVIHLPQITPSNAGLLEMTVPSLLTGYLCDVTGETYSRGFRDQWAMFRDGCGTCQSEIIIQ